MAPLQTSRNADKLYKHPLKSKLGFQESVWGAQGQETKKKKPKQWAHEQQRSGCGAGLPNTEARVLHPSGARGMTAEPFEAEH